MTTMRTSNKISTSLRLYLNSLGVLSDANDLLFIHLCGFLFLNGFHAQKIILTKSQPFEISKF